MIPRINRSRTQLWSRLNSYDEGPYSLFLSKDVYPELFDLQHREIARKAPHGWKASPKGKTTKYLWFPSLSDEEVETVEAWCERFGSYVLLGMNNHLADEFADELDFCLALDFNSNPKTEQRTVYGEARYQFKYQDGPRSHLQVLGNALVEAVADLPISAEFSDSYCLSCIPAPPDEPSIPRRLSQGMAKKLSHDFVDAELNCPKTGLKGVSVGEKIPIWRQLYSDQCVELTDSVDGRLVVVVDDLYQSGATMWTYAEFLKSLGARHVIGLACVKSLRDSDNQ